jgi:peptide/nickel transport system substrate-binding protein
LSDRGFWERAFPGRVNRRRALAGGLTVAGASALALAGCNPEQLAPAPRHSLLSTPEDSTSSAIPGGVFKSFIPTDVSTFDVLATSSLATQAFIGSLTYPRLVKFAAARYPDLPRGNIEGDLAEQTEMSGDRLQVTFRLRPGPRWESKAPTSGRPIDAHDVVFSWNKFARASPVRNDLAYHAQNAPASPIESVFAPDARTVVFRLKQPDSSVLALLASDRLFFVMPRESDGGFDPNIEIRGYGPWLLDDNRPGFFRSWRKNRDYHVAGRPFPDGLQQPVFPDYAARLSQFKIGEIWQSVVSQDDVIRTKKELPDTILRQSEMHSVTPSFLGFGYNGPVPWHDERLRQAISMLIDRPTLARINTNQDRFEAEGLDVGIRYHSVVGAGWEGFWVDPTNESQFGPTARYYRHDPAEANKLLFAAGFPEGLDTELHYAGSAQYPPIYARTAELVSGMVREGGVRARLDPREFGDWVRNYQSGYTIASNVGRQIRGFGGLVYRTGATYPSVIAQLIALFHKEGVRFMGMSPDGKDPHLGDHEVNQALEAVKREFDAVRQQEMVRDFARFMAKKAYFIPMQPHSALGFTVTWPVIGNQGVYRNWPGGAPATESYLHLWIDPTKPPLSGLPPATPTPQ